MYLTDKQGREFATKAEHEQFLRQADYVGQWEAAHRVPERKRLTWFFSDFGVHVPNDWVARNEIAEKFNEITGRQMKPELDPVVEMRSAVHSNYAGMVAMMGKDDRVYMGREENYFHLPGEIPYYDNADGSLCFVSDMPSMYYFLYGEGWHHSQEDMLERGLSVEQYLEYARLRDGVLASLTPRRELLFAGQPFQVPENYLRNAELAQEGQTGNYNMIDGLLNNEPPRQEERASVMERLKTERPEHGAQQYIPPQPEREI